jgi:hypothetical protein
MKIALFVIATSGASAFVPLLVPTSSRSYDLTELEMENNSKRKLALKVSDSHCHDRNLFSVDFKS